MSKFDFLIVGAGRGGTSLITALLDWHTDMTVLSEYMSAKYLINKQVDCDGLSLLDRRVSAFLDACEIKASQSSSLLWGNKITTEQIHGLEGHGNFSLPYQTDVIEQFFLRVEHLEVIFILRDGRSCINSKINRTGQSVIEACNKWKYSVLVYSMLLNRENTIFIKFEDLLIDPSYTLSRICNFLGVKYQSDMLNGVGSNILSPNYRNNKFDLGKLNTASFPKKYFDLICPELEFCGYWS